MKKTYIIQNIANDDIYYRGDTLDDICKWIDNHCSVSALHNNKIYANYGDSIITVDIQFHNKRGLNI